MKAILKIVALFSALLLAVEARAEGDDVFVPVAKYISRGDAESLTAWFADNLEISILSSSTDSSRSQASRILKNFFNSYSPRSFAITHTATQGNLKYALGRLSAGGEEFEVTIFMSFSETGYKIQQLKIDRTP